MVRLPSVHLKSYGSDARWSGELTVGIILNIFTLRSRVLFQNNGKGQAAKMNNGYNLVKYLDLLFTNVICFRAYQSCFSTVLLSEKTVSRNFLLPVQYSTYSTVGISQRMFPNHGIQLQIFSFVSGTSLLSHYRIVEPGGPMDPQKVRFTLQA